MVTGGKEETSAFGEMSYDRNSIHSPERTAKRPPYQTSSLLTLPCQELSPKLLSQHSEDEDR